MLTKEILLARRASLEADAHAIDGAIQQCDWSLDYLEAEEKEVGDEKSPASD